MLADQSLYLHKPSADEAYSPHMCIKTNYFMVQFPGQNSSTITFHHYKSLHVAVQQLHIQGVLWKSSWIQLIACAYVYMEMNYLMVQFPGQNSSTITFHHYMLQYSSSFVSKVFCGRVPGYNSLLVHTCIWRWTISWYNFLDPECVQTQSLDLANHQWV